MKELILEALRESVKRYPDIVPYLEGKAALIVANDGQAVKGVIDRDELERRLTRVIDSSLRAELKKLLDYLGDPPDLGNVPYSYWQNGWKKLRKVVEPILMDVYIGYAEAAMARVGIGVEWTLVNTRASSWAREHGDTILKQLFDRTYEGVSQTVPQYFEQGWTSKELAKELERYYSPVRAEMIAITESTRAAVEGERAYVAQLEAETGRKMVPIWLTANDERVCPICGPRHEKPITWVDYPPAHPRCRCGVSYEFEATLNPEQAVLWQSR